MKRVIAVLMVLATFGMVFAQQGTSLTDPDPTIIGADSAKQALREVSVDLFEREGSWNARISSDNGVISSRLFDGSPASKEPMAENEGVTDERVLGVKVEFFRRGINSFYVTAARPIPIEGITKTVSVWVTGRNQGHNLYLLVQDYFGNNFEIYMGSLAFSGWKKMTAAVPPSPDGERGIVQQSAYYGERPGLRIIGFRIDCDPLLARGSYYLYFDDLRAVTDLYDMENRNEDDMIDNW
ncbi:MAG: flagellar filament outer layer protein FlaA [Treponema sp.]|nr:flagellar filament protein FlaA [Spirochaetaceae bacterium]MCI6664231.1 flagellar filament outer layer protein FlaA [Spirochaetia bacterium]MDD7275267.1 flagellar filament outer layer protein FlaA [Treponema sp.]MDY4674056.1 flagellar filament outer layer protein FlaA [Treponema sp.]